MKLIENDNEKHWAVSYSGLDRFRSCPEKHRKVLAGEVTDMPGEEAFRGIFAHAACAETVNSGKPLSDPLAVITEAAADEIETYGESGFPIPWTSDTLTRAAELYELWLDKAYPHTPQGLVVGEHSFDLPLGITRADGLAVHARGFADVIAVEEHVVIDWKFSGASHWKKDWWKHVRYDHQPTLYMWAASVATGTPIEDWRFYYCVINPKTNAVFIPDAIERTAADVHRLVLEVGSMARLCDTNPEGPWPLIPNDWDCSPKFCPAYRSYQCMGAYAPPEWMVRDQKGDYLDWLANHPLTKKVK